MPAAGSRHCGRLRSSATLDPGQHLVEMIFEGRIVYREEITIDRGQEIIMAAWDGYDDGRSPREPR